MPPPRGREYRVVPDHPLDSIRGHAAAGVQAPDRRVRAFCESAEWIRTVPDCRGQVIPVVTTDKMAWYKPGFAQELYGSIYGHYLEGFAPVISMEELAGQHVDSDLVEELRRRLDGQGCPILAWSVHNMARETLQWAEAELLRATNRPVVAGTITLREFHKGQTGYALYLVR